MKNAMKQYALALGLAGAAALLTGPALANSLHNEGDFGGTYRKIGPGGPERYDYVRHHTFGRYYRAPAYSYYPAYPVYRAPAYRSYSYYGGPYYGGPSYSYYTPGAYYDYAPRVGVWGPGFGVSF